MKDLTNTLNRLRMPTGHPTALLIGYTDGIHLDAIIVQRRAQQLHLLATSQRVLLTEQGLSELLQDFQQQTEVRPARAWLVHERMASGLLELPGGDKLQLTEEKIGNIVHWEMETLYGDQVQPWKIGSLLVALGHLDAVGREDVLQLQKQQRQRAAGVGGKIQRFGELAVAENLLSAQDVEQALQWLDDYSDHHNAISSGYQVQHGRPDVYATAISEQEKHRCMNLFEQAGVCLDGFFPVSALLPIYPKQSGGVSVCLETQTQIICADMQGTHIVNFEAVNRQDNSLPETNLKSLLHACNSATQPWYIWLQSGVQPQAGNSIAQLYGQMAETIPLPEEFIGADNALPDHLPMLAVAWNYFFPEHGVASAYVIGSPPPPPFYRKKNVQLAAVGLFVLLLMLSFDSYYHHQLDSTRQELSELNEIIRNKSKTNKQRKHDNRIYAKLESELTQLQQTYTDLQQRKQAIEVNLIERQQFMRAFLKQLIDSIDQDAVLEEINEDNWYVFQLRGWALNQAAINRFESKLTRTLQTFNMHISKTPSTLVEQGELSGAYRFDFEIVRDNFSGPHKS